MCTTELRKNENMRHTKNNSRNSRVETSFVMSRLRLMCFFVGILLLAVMVHVPKSKAFTMARVARSGSVRVLGARGRSSVGGLRRAAAGDSGSQASSSGGGATCTCRNCKRQFQRESNTDDACTYHPGLFSGRLNRVNDVDTSGLEFFWSCCGEPDLNDSGCTRRRHVSYDDPPDGGEGGWRSPLTGTVRTS